MKLNKLTNRLRHSLSAKLLGLFVLMSIMLLLIVGGNIAHTIKNNFKENIRPHLLQYLEYVQNDIGTPADKNKALEITNKLSVNVAIVSENESWSSNNKAIDLSQAKIYRSFVENGVNYSTGELDDFEVLIVKHETHTLIFSIPHPRGNFRHKHILPLILIIALLVLFYFIMRKLFLPIKTLQHGIKRIGEGELEHRIDIKRKDELGDLAISINKMSDDIQQMLEAKRQLLLAISHELRSPVTRAKVAAALLPENKYTTSIEQELNEIDTLIEEILETERLSSHHHKLNKSSADIVEVTNATIAKYFSDKNLTVKLEKLSYKIEIDVPRIKLLIKNIIDNALKHTPNDASAPIVSLSATDQHINFSVQDFGSGIEPQHIPQLTEPFYRVDPSRRRETGGFGLGLYLCKMIVSAHNGELHITSEVGKGTVVNFTIPLKSQTT